MKREQIQLIKNLTTQKKFEDLETTLKKWLINKEIEIDDLIESCSKNIITISHDILNKIGLLYGQGKEEFTQNPESAFKLYQFAAKLGNAGATGNSAQYYFDGRAPGGKNLESAYILCQKAIQLGANRNFLMGEILYEQRQYLEAIQPLKLIINNQKSSKEEKDKAAELEIECLFAIGQALYQQGNFQEAVKYLRQIIEKPDSAPNKQKKEAREIEKACLTRQLELLYEKTKNLLPIESVKNKESVGDSITNPLGAMSLSESVPTNILQEDIPNQKALPGWSLISQEIDAFDINDCTELTMRVKLIELEVQAAEAALDIAQKHVAMARENKLPKEILEALAQKQKEYNKIYQELEAKKETILQAYQSYIDTTEQIIRRQNQTEQRFFNPRRTKKQQTFQLAMELEKRRLHEDVLDPLVLGIDQIPPARRMITAERSTMEASIELFGRASSQYGTKTGWSSNPNSRINLSSYYSSYTQDYSFIETIQIGNSQIQYKQRTDPHYNHLGDYIMQGLGAYNNIITVLNKITGSNAETANVQNERKLAELMLKFSHDGKPVNLQQLQEINEEAMEVDVNNLNRVFYHCFVKEIARWMLPKDKSHELPLATAQSRALQLIKNGHLTIKEVFSQHAAYGVFTGQNIGNDMAELREKIVRINMLYNKAILEQRPNNFLPYIQFWKEHNSANTLPSRKELRHELQETFGGESDTDGEDYESDNERESLCKKITI